jgi:hypothetical protein
MAPLLHVAPARSSARSLLQLFRNVIHHPINDLNARYFDGRPDRPRLSSIEHRWPFLNLRVAPVGTFWPSRGFSCGIPGKTYDHESR